MKNRFHSRRQQRQARGTKRVTRPVRREYRFLCGARLPATEQTTDLVTSQTTPRATVANGNRESVGIGIIRRMTRSTPARSAVCVGRDREPRALRGFGNATVGNVPSGSICSLTTIASPGPGREMTPIRHLQPTPCSAVCRTNRTGVAGRVEIAAVFSTNVSMRDSGGCLVDGRSREVGDIQLRSPQNKGFNGGVIG